jgi:Fe-S cluster assembly protein SufD
MTDGSLASTESLQLAAGAASVLRPETPPEPVAPVAPHSHGLPVGAAVDIASRATRTTSFDLADFPVPGGREEEWRFTPLDRLRGLHDGTAVADGKVVVEFDAADGVTVEFVDRGDARLGRAGQPGDRVAAQAWTSFERATVVSVPAETGGGQAHRGGRPRRGRAWLRVLCHVLVDVAAFAQATVVLDYAGSTAYAENVELRSATAPL